MIREPYSERYYSYNSKYISNVLSLRAPQHESLEVFARICDILSLAKKPADADGSFYDEDLRNVRECYPTLTSFEREFPSICFALATGIGKTRLMGACIAYLHYEKGIRNFFVMAPNLTIYRKLKDDLGNPANPKYVFRGLDRFVNPPRIIDGDNYGNFRQGAFGFNDVVINVFNISKLNAESKDGKGGRARIKRLNEVLGESYFEYLQSLPDLCIFMDESHHYHADRSFEVINDLRPILGVELTATPQIQKGARKIDFRNVVYEYSLAHALNDGMYVKVPLVATRENFRPEDYTDEQLDRIKLLDGLRIHEDTKSRLEVYARTFGKPIVKPFVLVVAKDTEHSKHIMDYVTSDEFFGGYYRDKVIEVNSTKKGAEKDENIELLLSLERPDNRVEIVIHVNMLKEGWDVTNLYTIVPLRTSASDTLTEQTIGRGLRLPYGERTGDEYIDRLTIVSHSKYAEIIAEAKKPDSLVRKVYFIDPTLGGEVPQAQTTVEMPTAYDTATSDESFVGQVVLALEGVVAATSPEEPETAEKAGEVARFVTAFSAKTVRELNKQVRTFDALSDERTLEVATTSVARETIRQFPGLNLSKEDLMPVIESAMRTCVQALTDTVIPIPQAVVQPFVEVKRGYYPFHLDTRNMSWRPTGDKLVGTELMEGGRTVSLDVKSAMESHVDTPENEIVRHIIVRDNIDYGECADLLYSLIGELKEHLLTYLDESEAEQVMRERQKHIAEMIYLQMNEHFYREETGFKTVQMRPFSRIESGFGSKMATDDIYDLRANVPAGEVRSKVFGGFRKACHTLYKFDSNTERTLAIVLENDDAVLRWMRPSPKQFNIYYDSAATKRYEPDFVVETEDRIYMVETKAAKEVDSEEVRAKAKAAREYCRAVTEWNADHNGKPWEYDVVPHDSVRLNFTFGGVVAASIEYDGGQLPL